MIPELRNKFNSEATVQKYARFLESIWKYTDGEEDFRICETPLFIDKELSASLITAAKKITDYLQTPEFTALNSSAVPSHLIVPKEDGHPLFLQIDFAISAGSDGKLMPKLIELQGFPSLYAFQSLLDEVNREVYSIPEDMTTYFNGLNGESYIELLKKTIVGNHKPENVVLLEIEPQKQKTRIDFYLTNKYLGIEAVCVSKIIKKGKKLFYRKDDREILVERIYNRVIFDELVRKNLPLSFDFRDDLEIEWAGHPNWFFKISKHSLPLIKNEFVPECHYLNDLSEYPENLADFVLKPLYSFAGSGVVVDVSQEILNAIPDRENYILQEKIKYAPLIRTPEGDSMAEIRLMFIWDDKPLLVNNLLRTSKGKMMGVDFNKGKTWVGSNIAYHY